MTNTEVDKVLAEKMRLCTHYFDWDSLKRMYICRGRDCKIEKKGGGSTLHSIPSPTTNWNDYGEVLEWAKKQMWFDEMVSFAMDSSYLGCHAIVNAFTSPSTGSHAIAEFLEERKKTKDD